MSDDKKRDRALQRRVRERQAKTGESYQAAWRQLTGSDAPASDELPRGDEIDPDEDNLSPPPSPRLVLPLSLPHRVPPHQPTRVTARAKGAINIERIAISNAGTKGGAADWTVNDIEVDGRSQLAMKNLSGAMFGGSIAANSKASTTLSIQGFDPIEHGHECAIIVTYVGPNPEGAPFFGAVVGTPPPQRPTVVPIASKSPLLPTIKTTITARVQNASFQMQRLEIDDGNTAGGSADWNVEDLRINGRSLFSQPGPIPGDMFSSRAIDTFVKLADCGAGSMIEVDVIYIGLDEHGARFTAKLEGTVVRDDYDVAPPDLRVVVETSGQGPGDEVIATCNWRPSITSSRRE